MSSSNDSIRGEFVEELSTSSLAGGNVVEILGSSPTISQATLDTTTYTVTTPASSDTRLVAGASVSPSISPSLLTYTLDSSMDSRPQTPRFPTGRMRRPWTARTLMEELGALSARALLQSPPPAGRAATSNTTLDESASTTEETSSGIELGVMAHTDDTSEGGDFYRGASPVPTDLLTERCTSECRSPLVLGTYQRMTPDLEETSSLVQGNGDAAEQYTDRSTKTTQPTDPVTEYTEPDSIFEMYTPEFVEKLQTLHELLAADALACDAKWTLFVAAAMSYRYGCQLEPFPPDYRLPDGSCNIEGIVQVINDTPKLTNVLHSLEQGQLIDISTEVIGLLHFVLVRCGGMRLRTLREDEFLDLLLQFGRQIEKADYPTNVFEVMCCDEQTQWRGDNDTKTEYGFHGNKLESFYSILQNGFAATDVGRMNFVTKQLHVAMSYSPNDPGWGASACGPLVACVGLCECNVTPSEIEPEIMHTSARLRYLLFYGCSLPTEIYDEPLPWQVPQRRRSRRADNTAPSWFKRHRYALTLIGYSMMFTSIALINGSAKQLCQRICSRAIGEVSEICKRVVYSA